LGFALKDSTPNPARYSNANKYPQRSITHTHIARTSRRRDVRQTKSLGIVTLKSRAATRYRHVTSSNGATPQRHRQRLGTDSIERCVVQLLSQDLREAGWTPLSL